MTALFNFFSFYNFYKTSVGIFTLVGRSVGSNAYLISTGDVTTITILLDYCVSTRRSPAPCLPLT